MSTYSKNQKSISSVFPKHPILQTIKQFKCKVLCQQTSECNRILTCRSTRNKFSKHYYWLGLYPNLLANLTALTWTYTNFVINGDFNSDLLAESSLCTELLSLGIQPANVTALSKSSQPLTHFLGMTQVKSFYMTRYLYKFTRGMILYTRRIA